MTDTFWGVVIGALAAILGAIISELLKYHLEKKRFILNKRALAYEDIQRWEYRYQNHTPDEYIDSESENLLEKATILLLLYGSHAVVNSYLNLADVHRINSNAVAIAQYKKSLSKLVKEIRSELSSS